MSLRGCVDALMARLRPTRLIVVMPDDGPAVRELPDGRGWVLRVPESFEDDPRPGLTDRQRRMIGPDDQVVIVQYVNRGIDANTEEDDGDPDDAGPPRAA